MRRISIGLVSWNEAFAHHYYEWSADMTEDVGFYVELARQADGPLLSLGSVTARWPCPLR